MNTAAIQAKDGPERHRRPLRIFHPAIAAFVVSGYGLDDRLIGRGHLHHVGLLFLLVGDGEREDEGKAGCCCRRGWLQAVCLGCGVLVVFCLLREGFKVDPPTT